MPATRSNSTRNRRPASRRRNADVVDQAAAAGMQVYESLFAIPSAVLGQSIKTGLSLKDAVKKKLLNPITDRALRYRANAEPPEGPEQCAMCGSKASIDVGHIDGHEENNSPDNLMWVCRSCNVTSANTMRNAGLGRLTHQYNPAGATTVGEWAQAVGAIIPHNYPYRNEGLRAGSSMPVAEAVAIIRATSQGKRSQFASQLGKHKGSRRNPENLAAHFFKKFHGRNSEEELALETSVHYHEWLATLGILSACVVDTPSGFRATITFDEKDAPWLCSNEDGTQLFIEGGNQELDLKALEFTGHELTKERIVVGQFSEPEPGPKSKVRQWNLGYQCQKDFDDFEDILYQHDLSEPDEGEPKTHRRIPAYLEYEPLNKLLYITGGDYHIGLPAFQTSPGIEN